MSPLRRLLQSGASRLRLAGIANADFEAEVLLAAARGVAVADLRAELVRHSGLAADAGTDRGDGTQNPARHNAFEAFLARRIAREPLSYVVGVTDFFGRSFRVTRATLEPRVETETLVSTALEWLRSEGASCARAPHIVDLGTGSGVILVSLLAECPRATGLGVDISASALDVARENASRHGVQTRASFLESDWGSAVPRTVRADVVVSNPPYVSAAEWASSPFPEIRSHEPRGAFVANECDALAAYRAVARDAAWLLKPHGRCHVELGDHLAAPVAAIFAAAGLAPCGIACGLETVPRVASFIRREATQ